MRKTREEIVAELVSEYEKKVKEVMDWQEEHPEFRLIELEEYLLEVGKELTSTIAERVIEQKESKQPVEGPECEKCGKRMRNKGQKRKQVVTQVGDVEIERGYYWCPQCKSGLFPPGQRVDDMGRGME